MAMANAGPNTNGSQFFIVSGPSGDGLPPKYSLFGKVVKGLDVLEQMQHVPTDRQRSPARRRRDQLGHPHRRRRVTTSSARRAHGRRVGRRARHRGRDRPVARRGRRPRRPRRPLGRRVGRRRRRPRPRSGDVVADLGTVDGPGTAAAAAIDAFGGRLDVLVNNAAISLRKPTEELTAEEIDRVLGVNVRRRAAAHRRLPPPDDRRRCRIGGVDHVDQRPARHTSARRSTARRRRRSTG